MDGSIAPALQEPAITVVAPPPRGRGRKRGLLAIGVLMVLGIAGYFGVQYWTVGRFQESTDDAYTAADSVAIAARVSGYVTEVRVADNQLVHAGDVIARIDDRDFRAALESAQADVASADADIRNGAALLAQQTATIAQGDADVASAEAGVMFAQAEAQRYADLLRTGSGSAQRAQQADSDIRQKRAAVARADASRDAARAEVAVIDAQIARAAAARARARASVETATLNLGYTTITAPIDGAAGDRSLRLGQYVAPGTKLLSVVPTGRDIYVLANFKETQLGGFAPGQRVYVAVDMLGGKPLECRLDSLSPGTGSQFALLPPENATGNFTKIVQRVPVRVTCADVGADVMAKLRPGLSVTATVDRR